MDQPHEPSVLAKFSGYGGLLDALRARLDDKHVTHAVFDDITGIADGLTNKILKPVPIRFLLPNTLGDFVEAAGCQLWPVEDPGLNAQLERRLASKTTDAWPKARRDLHRTGASPAQVEKLTPLVLRELGRKGGRRRAQSLSAKRLSEIGRKGAVVTNKKRWGSRKLRRNLCEAAKAGAAGST